LPFWLSSLALLVVILRVAEDLLLSFFNPAMNKGCPIHRSNIAMGGNVNCPHMRAFAFLLLAAATAQAQFDLQDSHTTASLRGIHSLGNGIAWASGSNGTILKTEDGGKNWQTCTIPPGAEKLDFRGIQGFDAKTAIVMSSGTGDLSRLYKTTDGCKKWKLLFKNPDAEGFFDALMFRGTGWLLGDPVNGSFVLFASKDGGRHWYRQQNTGLKVEGKSQAVFAASNSSLTQPHIYVEFGTGGTAGAFIRSGKDSDICVDECSPEDMNAWGKKTGREQNRFVRNLLHCCTQKTTISNGPRRSLLDGCGRWRLQTTRGTGEYCCLPTRQGIRLDACRDTTPRLPLSSSVRHCQ
jgi:hypothetical protein